MFCSFWRGGEGEGAISDSGSYSDRLRFRHDSDCGSDPFTIPITIPLLDLSVSIVTGLLFLIPCGIVSAGTVLCVVLLAELALIVFFFDFLTVNMLCYSVYSI